MKKLVSAAFALLAVLTSCSQEPIEHNSLRAPAYPLVSIDPYTSAWSMYNHLYDGPVKHWTGAEFPLIGALKVDGEVYRFLGQEEVELSALSPLATEQSWKGFYTYDRPAGDWYAEDYNPRGWKEGLAGFGTLENPTSKTPWLTRNIWLRREVEVNENLEGKHVYLAYSNDDDAIFYINGVEVLNTGHECHTNAYAPIPDGIVRPGKNTLAAWCVNTGGLAYLDMGLMLQNEPHTILENAAEQLYADVQATQTRYAFKCGPVELELTFTAPLLLEDLELMSRPVNYISYKAVSKDGKKHDLELYLEASPRWALDNAWQPSHSEAFEKDGRIWVKTGSVSQDILGKKGDDVRIDWGWFYLSAKDGKAGIGTGKQLRQAFIDGSDFNVTKGDDTEGRMAIVQTLKNKKEGHVLIGYDDIYSIQYFEENLRPYWNRNEDKTIFDEFAAAEKDYASLMKRCAAFDRKLMEEAELAGGRKYAELCALAYRQSLHAHKLVQAPDGTLLWFSKENNSNGSIGTVDVTYPSIPIFLRYNPKFVEYLLNHIYYYSESGRWTKPFPAHDVGTYPIANGQTYGGDMPVEEAGNMIISTAAICKYEGSTEYAASHWETLTVWADYLRQFGLDPENQLCTDDFAGHFAHNANLSIKAILGVASYGYMAKLLGKDAVAEEYTVAAREMAAEWMKIADDGDHYRLTFDKPGTWSQKYNLVWDRLLGLDIFPEEVAMKEIAYYPSRFNEYGLPLDNRETYTKLDWIMWTATMATDKATFETFIEPVWNFENETIDRVPMSDWTYTDKPNYRGFKARSVVGGYFIKLLK